MNKTVTIIITGRPYSKKNSRKARTMRNKKTGKLYSFTVPSDNYESFEQSALYQLKKYHVTFEKLVRVDYYFYRKGNESQDNDNAMGSINDVLQKSKIISNDKHIRCGYFENIPDQKEWSTKLVITEYLK